MTTAPARSPIAGLAESMGAMTPVSRITLHDAVLNKLRDLIIEGHLPPGTRISEVQVGALLGVSRTPLREAIKSLAGEGLLEIAPSRGAIVRRFSQKDVADILEVLKSLEQTAGHLACLHADERTIAAIVEQHRQMLEAYAERDRLKYFKLNQAIHSAIVEASGNACLAQTHDMLQSRIRYIRFIGNRLPDRWAGAVAEHDEMIEALLARDGARLAAILGKHLDRTLERVRDAI